MDRAISMKNTQPSIFMKSTQVTILHQAGLTLGQTTESIWIPAVLDIQMVTVFKKNILQKSHKHLQGIGIMNLQKSL